MTLDFYSSSDDSRKLEKTMENKKTVSAVFAYENISILSPVFILKYDSDLLSKNYFYCDETGRWYAVTGFSLAPGGKLLVSGAVDVLSTYKDAIKNMKCTAVRATSSGFTMIPDTAFPITPGKENVTTVFLSASDLDPPGTLPPNQYRFVLTLKK